MIDIDPAITTARAFHKADSIAYSGDPTRADIKQASDLADAADHQFAESIPTTPAGVAAKLWRCKRMIAAAQESDEFALLGWNRLVTHIDTAIEGLIVMEGCGPSAGASFH